MLARELNFADPEPTRLRMDANAVLLGAKKEKVSIAMRYIAGRYAMLRAAVDEGEITLDKVASSGNRAGICTKPLTGAAFANQQAPVLGLAPLAPLKLSCSGRGRRCRGQDSQDAGSRQQEVPPHGRSAVTARLVEGACSWWALLLNMGPLTIAQSFTRRTTGGGVFSTTLHSLFCS